MILYHGSNLNIVNIDLSKCRPGKDFGKGFYVTELREQAEKMARRVARISGGGPVVNVYEIDDRFLDTPGLKVRNFGADASAEWAVFVMNNRSRSFKDYASPECNKDNKYDIVAGPIADDDMALLFRQYENQWIDFDALVKGMTYRDTTNQYSFHSERAIHLLHNVGTLE